MENLEEWRPKGLWYADTLPVTLDKLQENRSAFGGTRAIKGSSNLSAFIQPGKKRGRRPGKDITNWE